MRYFAYIGLWVFLLSGFRVCAQSESGEADEVRRSGAELALKKAGEESALSKPAAALRYYLSALYDFEVLGDSASMALINEKTGRLFLREKLYEKAAQYLGNAELIFLKLNTINEHQVLLLDLANTYFALQDYQKARVYFQRLPAMEKVSDSLLLLSYTGQLRCFDKLKLYDDALKINQKIIGKAEQKSDSNLLIAAYSNQGFVYQKKKMWEEALSAFNTVEQIEVKKFDKASLHTFINKAVVYQNAGENDLAIDALNSAADLAETGNDSLMASNKHLTALVYFHMKDYYNAGVYNTQCLEICKHIRMPQLYSDALLLSSKIQQAFYDYEGASESFLKHLAIQDSLERVSSNKNKELAETAFLVERISQETERLWAGQEMDKLNLQRLQLDSANRIQEIKILYKTDSLQKSTIRNKQLEKEQAMQRLLLREEQMFAARKAMEVDSLRQIQKIQGLELETRRLVQEEQENKIKLLDQEKQIADLNLKKIKTRNKYLFAFAILALVILYLVYRGLRFSRKTNRLLIKQNNEIERQKDEIQRQRERSDKLLLNILPEETAEELKEKGQATPQHYDQVSVLFTDFKGFTQIAEKLSPQELVSELNTCFLAFDNIIDKHGLEKIKTIGDAYMCAGGIPVANTTNPVDVVRAALEIREYMHAMKQAREAKGEAYWELRIGIHTGEVIAGVVGKNKFAYDIWGDAVNTASRMESSGIPGKVNISGTTFSFVRDSFACTYRGKVKAKNKGEIDMYIVEHEK